MISFALGLPHTPWVPARVASYERLIDGITPTPKYLLTLRAFTERAPNRVWSQKMWEWGAEQDATHFLTLQDDVIVAPEFWARLRAMVETVPDQVIGLEAVHPAGIELARQGHRWYTTTDCLIGVGYVVPTAQLREFLAWRASSLKPGALEAITEDTMLGLWCMVTGRKIWHPIPTIIDHDVSMVSTYGNDDHGSRRPLVRWDNAPEGVVLGALRAITEPPPCLGRFYEATPGLARHWVEGFSEADYVRAVRDDGRQVKRALSFAIRSRMGPPEHRVFLATPTRGTPHPEYHSTVLRTSVDETFELFDGWELIGAHQWSEDLVRVRSRFLRVFLETDATHLWFLDDDISCEPGLLRRLLKLGRDFVAVPYPRRRPIDWRRVAQDDGVHPEAHLYDYPVRISPEMRGGAIEPDGCTAVTGIGLGCTLLTRSCVERMVEHYKHDLGFSDLVGGEKHRTVALFQLLFLHTRVLLDEDGDPIWDRELLSEDHSFCARWCAMGGEVSMFLGAGSPATHHGDHAYRGHLEAFGVKLVEQ